MMGKGQKIESTKNQMMLERKLLSAKKVGLTEGQMDKNSNDDKRDNRSNGQKVK